MERVGYESCLSFGWENDFWKFVYRIVCRDQIYVWLVCCDMCESLKLVLDEIGQLCVVMFGCEP